MQTVRPTNSQTVAAIIRSGLEFHIDDVKRADIGAPPCSGHRDCCQVHGGG
jgi:hypothetical protein